MKKNTKYTKMKLDKNNTKQIKQFLHYMLCCRTLIKKLNVFTNVTSLMLTRCLAIMSLHLTNLSCLEKQDMNLEKGKAEKELNLFLKSSKKNVRGMRFGKNSAIRIVTFRKDLNSGIEQR